MSAALRVMAVVAIVVFAGLAWSNWRSHGKAKAELLTLQAEVGALRKQLEAERAVSARLRSELARIFVVSPAQLGRPAVIQEAPSSEPRPARALTPMR